MDIISSNYGGVLKRTDFENAPEESRLTINNWVSDNTAQKINNLLPQDRSLLDTARSGQYDLFQCAVGRAV
ncbi:MAG: hypothetical protein HC887_11655 [Desulfobacteraceae bacterium]|nr:hypothetical protein [Desulfobacteraceae bacterium]